MSVAGAGDPGITRRGFVAAAAGTVVGGGALLAPAITSAATVGGPASLLLSSGARYDFAAFKITPVGGTPPTSWHILLTATDPTDQAGVEALFQSFLTNARGVTGAHLLKGQLATYRRNGSLRARFAFKNAFPAAVALVEHAGLPGQVPLEAQLQWVAKTLRRVA